MIWLPCRVWRQSSFRPRVLRVKKGSAPWHPLQPRHSGPIDRAAGGCFKMPCGSSHPEGGRSHHSAIVLEQSSSRLTRAGNTGRHCQTCKSPVRPAHHAVHSPDSLKASYQHSTQVFVARPMATARSMPHAPHAFCEGPSVSATRQIYEVNTHACVSTVTLSALSSSWQCRSPCRCAP
jgi:hypothetical protein